jgi:hypothetical protein
MGLVNLRLLKTYPCPKNRLVKALKLLYFCAAKTTIMDAMLYEYLVRMAYNCGRGGAGGKAEADIYRKLERTQNAVEKKLPTRSIDDLEYEYRSAAATVSGNVAQALQKVEKGFYFTEENKHYKKRLDELAGGLSLCMDKEVIDRTIEESLDIFKELGLTVG